MSSATDSDSKSNLTHASRVGEPSDMHDMICRCITLRGDVSAVAYLLECGGSASAHDSEALFIACALGLESVCQLLIHRGADVNAFGKYRRWCIGVCLFPLAPRPLHQEPRRVRTSSVLRLLTPLVGAAAGGHVSVLRLLIDRGARLDGLNGVAALIAAAMCDRVEMFDELVNVYQVPASSPVGVAAASCGSLVMLNRVLGSEEHALSLDELTMMFTTACDFCQVECAVRVLEVLPAADHAAVLGSTVASSTELAVVCSGSLDLIVRLLHQRPAASYRVLYQAAAMGQLHVIDLLVKHGIDLNHQAPPVRLLGGGLSECMDHCFRLLLLLFCCADSLGCLDSRSSTALLCMWHVCTIKWRRFGCCYVWEHLWKC